MKNEDTIQISRDCIFTIIFSPIDCIIVYKVSARVAAAVNKFGNRCITARDGKLLRIKVAPDLHLTYSKNGGNLGLVLKMKNIACLSFLLTKHVKYTYL